MASVDVAALLTGIVVGILIAGSSWLMGFDNDRSFYPTVLIVIASYYVLFGFMAGEASVVVIELVIALAFVAVAVWGYYRALWIVAAGLIAHGVFDGLHNLFFINEGVPAWWHAFCLAVDVVLGVWLIVIMRLRHERNPQTTG